MQKEHVKQTSIKHKYWPNLLIFSYTLVDKRLWKDMPYPDLDIFFSLEVEISSAIQTFVSRQIEVDVFGPIN